MILHTVWVQSLENSLVKPSCAGGGVANNSNNCAVGAFVEILTVRFASA